MYLSKECVCLCVCRLPQYLRENTYICSKQRVCAPFSKERHEKTKGMCVRRSLKHDNYAVNDIFVKRNACVCVCAAALKIDIYTKKQRHVCVSLPKT